MDLTTRPGGEPALPDDAAQWHYLDAPVAVAIAQGVQTGIWSGRQLMPWAEIVCPHVEIATKDGAALVSFVRAAKPERRSDSVEFVSALVFDVDGKAGATWDDVLDRFEHVACWAYTTFSHTEEAHAFRVVLPLERAIKPADYAEAWNATVDLFGLRGIVDESCKDVARLFYVPSCRPGAVRWQYDNFASRPAPYEWHSWVAAARASKMVPTIAETFSAPQAEPYTRRFARDERHEQRRVALRALQNGLDKLSPDIGYNDWKNIALGAQKGYGAEGLDIVEAWSRRSSKYNPADWRAFRRKEGLGG